MLDCLWFVRTESIDDDECDDVYFLLFLFFNLLQLLFESIFLLFVACNESDDEHVEFARFILLFIGCLFVFFDVEEFSLSTKRFFPLRNNLTDGS